MKERRTEIMPEPDRLPVSPWPRISPPRRPSQPLFPGWGVKF
jgi:hypothetical protein